MRHRGAEVGHFFLAEKADGEAFTGEDEEVLELFASQAAAAIANARTHHNERRARADLEALVETSPVGVVVFDAKSGRAACSCWSLRQKVLQIQLESYCIREIRLSQRGKDGSSGKSGAATSFLEATHDR